MRSTLLIAAVAPLFLLVGIGLRPTPTEKPLVSLQGSSSAVTRGRVEVITDPNRWEVVWKEHKGRTLERTAHGFDVIPQVDFQRCMVFAAFTGTAKNGAGIEVTEVLTRDGHTVIRYDRIAFQTASFEGEDKGIDTTDYGFAVLSRTTLPIILEENTQSLIGHPPIWTERQRLPSPPPVPEAPRTN